MIKMEKIETPNDPQHRCTHHFVVSTNEPMRVEVTVDTEGTVVAQVYKGDKVDMEQEPVGAYDSTIGDNKGWISE